jgi:REP element-mobilizing transposase RayT
MSRKYKFYNPEGIYFVSFATIYWIDVFIRNTYKNVFLESLYYCQKNKGLKVHAWVIMTSHVHMIISSTCNKLEDIMRDMKSYTSGKIRNEIIINPQESRKEWMLWLMKRAGRKNGNNNDFQFWQQHNHPIELSYNKIMKQKLDYLHNNPVKAGFVNSPEEYKYSSAIDYIGGKGLLDDIELIE